MNQKLIGLYNLEPNIVNSAMMRVSKFHKDRGDRIEIYKRLLKSEYDKIYVFSIFDFTKKIRITERMTCGGSGFNLDTKLSTEIENAEYDWSLYPNCDFSIIWFSHGCIRKCPFCIVSKKEGYIYPVEPKNLNPNGEYIKVMDNNFFANPEWEDAIKQLGYWNKPCDFQGVDARLLDEKKCRALLRLNHYKQIHIAWDNPRENLVPKLKEIIKYIKPWRLMCYVLIGYWSTEKEDLYRVNELRKLGIDQFAMPFDKSNNYQRHFARYINFKSIRKTCEWEEYQKYDKELNLSQKKL